MQHGLGEVGDLLQAIERQRGLDLAQPKRLAGDRLGVVPDALELEVDADACVGEPQQPGRRLVADQEAEAESIELLLHLVDVAVAEDDRVGQVTVPAEHGPQLPVG